MGYQFGRCFCWGEGGQYPITWYGMSHLKELNDKWPVNGKHEYTAAGNMKSVPRRLIVEWMGSQIME